MLLLPCETKKASGKASFSHCMVVVRYWCWLCTLCLFKVLSKLSESSSISKQWHKYPANLVTVVRS
jgi:hypothetical protein